MSCDITYFLREEDGSVWWSTERHGHPILEVEDRDQELARIRRERRPIDGLEDGFITGAYCKGALYDLVARRYRYYPCYGDETPLDRLDATIRAAPIWHGWDAGVALGGREEMGELVPEASRTIMPFNALHAPPPAVDLIDREEWLIGWDAAGRVLTVRESAQWAGISQPFDVLTVVAPNAAALDFRLSPVDVHPVHPVLARLHQGPQVLDALSATPPYPTPYEGERVRSTAVIDRRHSIIYYSPTALVPQRLLRAIAAAWPGWALRVLPSPPESRVSTDDDTGFVYPRIELVP